VRYFYLLRSPDNDHRVRPRARVTLGTREPGLLRAVRGTHAGQRRGAAVEKHPQLPEEADLSLLVEPWETRGCQGARILARDRRRTRSGCWSPTASVLLQDPRDRVHRFYHAGNEKSEHRVVVDDAKLTRARVELCRAARHTLKDRADLMGVSAPTSM